MKRNESEKSKIVESVAVAIETTDKRIIDICNENDVHYRTFNTWIHANENYRKRYNAAKANRYKQQTEIIDDTARKSLIERIQAQTVTETKTAIRYSPKGSVIDKTVTTTERIIPASEKLIQFVLSKLMEADVQKRKQYKRKKLDRPKR